jgi:serine protease 12 (motopsin)
MRLMGGRNEREGRVEVFLDGEWGTICGDLWEDTQTKVVCRQLNFFAEDQSKLASGGYDTELLFLHLSVVLTVAHNPEFFSGEGTGPVHMDSVLCNGDEPLLVNCSYSVKSDCSHSKDIGIVCPGKNLRLLT